MHYFWKGIQNVPTLFKLMCMTLKLTGGFLFIISLTKCFDIDPETDASITVYCDNLSALIQVEKPLRKRSTRHHMIPEYNLVKKLQQ